jgi:hypothetical protein
MNQTPDMPTIQRTSKIIETKNATEFNVRDWTSCNGLRLSSAAAFVVCIRRCNFRIRAFIARVRTSTATGFPATRKYNPELENTKI